MKKLMSIAYAPAAFNIGLFILRAGTAILLMHHGYDKIQKFDDYSAHFVNFLGLGGKTSLSLAIFGEFFCCIFLAIGLFTRLAVIPPIIVMLVVIFNVWAADFFGRAEEAVLFLLPFLMVLLVGPGKISVDGAVNK